jgi:Flp pilus assembly protein TadB
MSSISALNQRNRIILIVLVIVIFGVAFWTLAQSLSNGRPKDVERKVNDAVDALKADTGASASTRQAMEQAAKEAKGMRQYGTLGLIMDMIQSGLLGCVGAVFLVFFWPVLSMRASEADFEYIMKTAAPLLADKKK